MKRSISTLLFLAFLQGGLVAADPGLRELALTGDQKQLGFEFPDETWAVVMETGLSGGYFNLVMLYDGTTSLYLSNGGGIIGAGEHGSVAQLSKKVIGLASSAEELFSPTTSLQVPADGEVRIYLRNGPSLSYLTASEATLGEGQHEASRIFYAAHQVIAEIRRVGK